jgi:hypothetical protein
MNNVRLVFIVGLVFLLLSQGVSAQSEPCPDMSGSALMQCLTTTFGSIRDEQGKIDAFNSLTPEQISDIQAYLAEGPLVAEVSITEPGIGASMILPSFGPNYACREVVYSLLKKDAIGTWLWRYSQYFNWCYNNRIIKTRADSTPVVQIFFPFWFF